MTQGVYTGKDRRTSVRFRFNALVKVSHDGGEFEAKGTDFNDDAISIIYEKPLDVGTKVVLSVVDELGNNITLTGEIARASEPDDEGMTTMVVKRDDTEEG